MGKGDKKSKRGKIRLGSWGNTRPRRKKGASNAVATSTKKVAAKKTSAKKTKKAE